MSLEIPIVVVAGNRRQFDYWCHAQAISPRSAGVKFVEEGGPYPDGFASIRLIYVGTWIQRKDLAELESWLAVQQVVPFPSEAVSAHFSFE